MVFTDKLNKAILESSPDATIVADRKGDIVFVNQRITEVFGYHPSELIGKPIELLLPEAIRQSHISYRQHYSENPTPRNMGDGRDLFGLRKNGEAFPVEVSLSPVESETGKLVIGAIRDVSERKIIDRQLIEARDEALSANQTKSQFLAMASHDLRQPVQTLTLLNKSLERLAKDTIIRNVVLQQGETLSSMSELLNTLLDISKLESGVVKPDITDFAVSKIFKRMRSQFQEQAEAKGLELVIENGEGQVSSDPTLLEQIIQNLLANAIRYTNSGRVWLRSLAQKNSVRIEVFDTGVGIPSAQLSAIFNEFHQVPEISAKCKNDGFGLGLAIVDRVARLLDLKIDVESSAGKGSRFYFDVPNAVNRPGDTAIASVTSNNNRSGDLKTPSQNAGVDVLLIEDDEPVRDATLLFLKIEGFAVKAAQSIKEAKEIAAQIQPKLIVSDYHLFGEETGKQAIKQLREIVGIAIPAIIISGDTSSVLSGGEIEACEILSKPIKTDQLIEMINNMLDR